MVKKLISTSLYYVNVLPRIFFEPIPLIPGANLQMWCECPAWLGILKHLCCAHLNVMVQVNGVIPYTLIYVPSFS